MIYPNGLSCENQSHRFLSMNGQTVCLPAVQKILSSFLPPSHPPPLSLISLPWLSPWPSPAELDPQRKHQISPSVWERGEEGGEEKKRRREERREGRKGEGRREGRDREGVSIKERAMHTYTQTHLPDWQWRRSQLGEVALWQYHGPIRTRKFAITHPHPSSPHIHPLPLTTSHPEWIV